MTGPGPLESQVPLLGAADLERMLAEGPGRIFLLDTRSRESFEAGHLPGSYHCPVHELSRREKELPPRASTVIVIGEPGRRSAAAGVFLILAGYVSVLLLEGGYPSWRGTVETGPGRPLSEAHPPKPPGWVDPPKGGGRDAERPAAREDRAD